MTIPVAVAPEETLGRGVSYRKDRDRARRGIVPYSVFFERPGVRTISVDRLDTMARGDAVRVAEEVAAARGRAFHGWATVRADRAAAEGRLVKATPRAGHEFHADIVLPPLAGTDRNEQKEHAKQLAGMAEWRERPAPASGATADARVPDRRRGSATNP